MKSIKIYFPVVLIFFSFIFSSCKVSMFYTTLDVLRPAQVEFKSGVRNILIVNNTTPQSDDVGHVNQMLNGNIIPLQVPTDSISTVTLNVFAEEIRGIEFFSSVKVISESVNENTDFNQIIPLQYKEVNELSSSNNVDAIISLDFLRVKHALIEDYDWGTYYAVLEVVYESLWSVHYPNDIQVVPLHFIDTLYWEEEAYSLNRAIEKLPDRSEALIGGAVMLGLLTADRFIPYWEEQDRYFYSPKNQYMQQAMDSVYVKNWSGAIELWKKSAEKVDNKNTSIYAFSNIAIAYEILGDYDSAIHYAQQVLDILESRSYLDMESIEEVSRYKNYLQIRKQEIEKLDKQLTD